MINLKYIRIKSIIEIYDYCYQIFNSYWDEIHLKDYRIYIWEDWTYIGHSQSDMFFISHKFKANTNHKMRELFRCLYKLDNRRWFDHYIVLDNKDPYITFEKMVQ